MVEAVGAPTGAMLYDARSLAIMAGVFERPIGTFRGARITVLGAHESRSTSDAASAGLVTGALFGAALGVAAAAGKMASAGPGKVRALVEWPSGQRAVIDAPADMILDLQSAQSMGWSRSGAVAPSTLVQLLAITLPIALFLGCFVGVARCADDALPPAGEAHGQ